MLALTLPITLAALASAPTVPDHFPDDGALTHAFLLVDGSSGAVVRAEGGDALDEHHPWGDLRRLVQVVAALEDGSLDPQRTVRCDSTCWAVGGHGDVALQEGLAWGCDRWAAAVPEPPADALDRAARALGLAGADEAGGRVTAAECVAFWRILASLALDLRADTSTQLLAVAGAAVTSPRGSARLLYDPRRRTRAFVFGGDEGAWAIGGRTVLGREWAFALYVPGGSATLAAARAAALLEDTRRVARKSTAERGGIATDEPAEPDETEGGAREGG